jgi:hypothetical protein
LAVVVAESAPLPSSQVVGHLDDPPQGRRVDAEAPGDGGHVFRGRPEGLRGPVPIKPNANNQPDQLVPQSQVYLVDVALVEPGADLQPGNRARVKVHCKKQTLAWWVWRTINDTFNLGLM